MASRPIHGIICVGREGPLEVVDREGAVAKTEVHERQVVRNPLIS